MTTYFIAKDFFEYKECERSAEELVENIIETEYNNESPYINWKKVKDINTDIIAWLEIEGTKINYPILQDNENLFYLRHNYKKQYSVSGSIFTINEKAFKDKETIIYGHNMKNRTMFSELGNYMDKDFFYKHQNFKIYTSTGNYKASVFSVYSIGIETEDNNIKQLNFEQKIEYYKNASKYKVENIEIPKKIVKLSTCSYINAKTRPTDKRYYIIASIIPID